MTSVTTPTSVANAPIQAILALFLRRASLAGLVSSRAIFLLAFSTCSLSATAASHASSLLSEYGQ